MRWFHKKFWNFYFIKNGQLCRLVLSRGHIPCGTEWWQVSSIGGDHFQVCLASSLSPFPFIGPVTPFPWVPERAQVKLTNSICIPRMQWGPGRRWLTLLRGGHSSNPARWPMSAWVWCNTGASIVVTVRCHGKGQGLEVSTDLLCQVSAQVSRVAVRLPFGIGKWAGTKVSSSLGVLEKKANKGCMLIYLF